MTLDPPKHAALLNKKMKSKSSQESAGQARDAVTTTSDEMMMR
jgi:hypothetical protein